MTAKLSTFDGEDFIIIRNSSPKIPRYNMKYEDGSEEIRETPMLLCQDDRYAGLRSAFVCGDNKIHYLNMREA